MNLDMKIEPVCDVPQWVRGDSDSEVLRFTIITEEGTWPKPNPSERTCRVLANGMSIGTGADGVKGKIISVAALEDLEKMPSSDVQGAIVLYDWRHYTQYGLLSGPFRGNGANHAISTVQPPCSYEASHPMAARVDYTPAA